MRISWWTAGLAAGWHGSSHMPLHFSCADGSCTCWCSQPRQSPRAFKGATAATWSPAMLQPQQPCMVSAAFLHNCKQCLQHGPEENLSRFAYWRPTRRIHFCSNSTPLKKSRTTALHIHSSHCLKKTECSPVFTFSAADIGALDVFHAALIHFLGNRARAGMRVTSICLLI